MKQLFFVLMLFATFVYAKSSALTTPQAVVLKYHQAINSGDIKTLQQVSVADTFDTDMEVYSLSIALADQKFRKVRKAYDSDPKAKEMVIHAVQKKLQHRKPRKISDLSLSSLGDKRAMVRFLENNKKKQLYLSLERDGWKINYLAGRKTH